LVNTGRSALHAFASNASGQLAAMTEPWKPHVLRQYAFIADGERGALVDPDGALGWLIAAPRPWLARNPAGSRLC
jgi:hypothetical protein